jgi:hypothetical protein
MAVGAMQFWVLTRREVIERVIDRKFVLATILTPLLLACCLALPHYLGFRVLQKQFVYVVYDGTGGDIAEELSWSLAPIKIGVRGRPEPLLRMAADGTLMTPEGLPPAPFQREELNPTYVFADADIAPDAPPAPHRLREQGSMISRFAIRAYLPEQATDVLPIREIWDPSSEEVKQAVRDELIAGYLVFPPSFVEDGYFHLYTRRATDLEGFLMLKYAVDRVLKIGMMRAQGIDSDLLDQFSRVARADIRTPDQRVLNWSDQLGALTAGLLLYLTITLFGNSVLHAVLEDRQSRIAARYLAGKVAGGGIAGFLQYAVWVAAYAAVLRLWPRLSAIDLAFEPSALLVIAGGFLLGFAVYAPLMAMVGTMADSAQEAVQVAMPFVILQSMPVLVMYGVLRDPTAPWAVFATWFPLTAPFVAPGVHIVEPMEAWELASIAVICVVGAMGTLALASAVFRHHLLRVGQTVSWLELFRRLRGKHP